MRIGPGNARGRFASLPKSGRKHEQELPAARLNRDLKREVRLKPRYSVDQPGSCLVRIFLCWAAGHRLTPTLVGQTLDAGDDDCRFDHKQMVSPLDYGGDITLSRVAVSMG